MERADIAHHVHPEYDFARRTIAYVSIVLSAVISRMKCILNMDLRGV